MAANHATTLLDAIAATTTAFPTASSRAVLHASGQSWFGSIGHGLLLTMKAVPTFFVWLAAFVTFTLPAWLFTGLSTSLTFTVNATTL